MHCERSVGIWQILVYSLCTEPNFSSGIVWCYSEKSAVPREKLTSLHKNFNFHEGVPPNFGNGQCRPCLIILDDLLNEVYSKDVCDLFTKGSHHRNISVILITQNVFHQGLFCRAISLNAKYSVALKKSETRVNFNTWRDKCIPKLAILYTGRIWKLPRERTIISY